MRNDRPPYIGRVEIRDWITKDQQHIKGIRVSGKSGIAGHLSTSEARTLADTLHDLADQLEQANKAPQHQEPPRVLQPTYTGRSTLTAADGTPEQPLPATQAD